MAVYVALVGAIGPVTHAKMGMSALRDACEKAGLADVVTVGNTGSLIFRSDAGRGLVRETVQRVVHGFDLDNDVFIRSPCKMAEGSRPIPFLKPLWSGQANSASARSTRRRTGSLSPAIPDPSRSP